MSDYDDDELPSISVNCLDTEYSSLVMPDAGSLAMERAVEVACDHEVRRRRDALRAAEAGGAGGAGAAVGGVVAVRHDSSGSEGEAALAATLLSLQVAAAAESPTPAAQLLQALAQAATPGELRDTLDELCAELTGTPQHADTVLQQLAECIFSQLLTAGGAGGSGGAGASDAELAAWCCVCACASCAPTARRLLHRLLDDEASEQQVRQVRLLLARAAAHTAHTADTAARAARRGLQLHARLLSGAGGGADECARAVLAAVLRAVLGNTASEEPDAPLPEAELVSLLGGGGGGGWRALDTRSQYLAVQLLARWRAQAGGGGGARTDGGGEGALAAALGSLAPASRDRNNPDALKVLVGVTQLNLLFRSAA